MPNTVKTLRILALQAASEQFERTATISMRKLGTTLGVSAPALYHHFASKQHILDAVADQAFTAFEKRLRSVRPTDTSENSDPRATIHAVLTEYRRFAGDHPNLFGLMFVAPRPVARRFPRDFAAHRSAVFNILWNAVDTCLTEQADGAPGDSLYLAHDLWALAHGQILLWRAERFENDQAFDHSLQRSIERFLSTL